MNTEQRINLEKLISNKIFSELYIDYNIDYNILETIDTKEVKEIIQGDIIPRLNRILLKLSNGALYLWNIK